MKESEADSSAPQQSNVQKRKNISLSGLTSFSQKSLIHSGVLSLFWLYWIMRVAHENV